MKYEFFFLFSETDTAFFRRGGLHFANDAKRAIYSERNRIDVAATDSCARKQHASTRTGVYVNVDYRYTFASVQSVQFYLSARRSKTNSYYEQIAENIAAAFVRKIQVNGGPRKNVARVVR